MIAASRGGSIGDPPSFGDVERVGRFLCSAGPAAFFDVLWLPAFIASVFFLHPALGFFAVSVVVVLIGLSVVAEARSREPGKKLGRVRLERYALQREFNGTGRLRGDAADGPHFARRWRRLSGGYFHLLGQSQERAHALSALGKSLRAIMQSVGLGLGALLAIEGAISAGALVASSVLVGRTFACLDAALAHWPNFVAARDSSLRLTARAPASDRQGPKRSWSKS
jgi:ABC-type protease/lipase transport system fused ATPase/permease subunit